MAAAIAAIPQKISEKCTDKIFGYCGRVVKRLWYYSANIKKLQEEVEHLSDAARHMEARMEDARNRDGETRVDAVAEGWLKDMASVTQEISTIIQQEDIETRRCFRGLRPNIWECYWASRSAEKLLDSAGKLRKDGENISTVAHVDYTKAMGFAINPDYQEFESRQKCSEKIVAYLKDPAVRIVGMYGMGGSGKTTLAEKMGQQLYRDGTFQYVVKANISNSEETNLFRIQKQIADVLKIEFKDDQGDVMSRANQVREKLMGKDRLLIILDDVWSSFDLRDVGIPFEGELKILITSRDLSVMNCLNSKHNVQLDVLSPKDSWILFEKMADGVDTDSEIYSTALEIVEQCGGIPVLLVPIARALRNADLETWKEALFQLTKFEMDNFVEDGYKRLEVSYNFLPNDEVKAVFLLCAQLDHRSISISDLLKYTIGLNLFSNRNKLGEVRSRLYMYLSHLRGYCLLQDTEEEDGEQTVRMHDVIYRFAVSIAYRDHRVFSTPAGLQLQEWPSKDELEQFSAISLPHCSFPPDNQLPVAFKSSNLKSFLLLQDEDGDYVKVTDGFFTDLQELMVIDIRRRSVSLSSIHLLVKLRTLCLDYCELDDVSVIGDLPILQVLSLKGSSISQIRSLGKSLKMVDLTDCKQLIVIASGVLSSLTLLEDFRIGGESFDKWEHETLASLREFKNLVKLMNLEINIPDRKKFFKDLGFEKLERYRIAIGCRRGESLLGDGSKSLSVNFGEDSSQQLYKKIQLLIEKVKYLQLEGVVGFTNVYEMAPQGFGDLIYLRVHKSAGIRSVVKKRHHNWAVFPKLEELFLMDMRKLERICDDHLVLPVGSFQNLTTIHVSRSNVLQNLFSFHLASRGLSCLKDIQIMDCQSIESIVSRESENRITEVYHQSDDAEQIIEFPQLQRLMLFNLCSFISFFCSATISSSQERQQQDPSSSNQRLLTSLFNRKVVLPKLEVLYLAYTRVEQIWDDQLPTEACWVHNLKSLRVQRCNNVTYLFTSTMVKSLSQLRELDVNTSESIEEIVATGEERVGDNVKFCFPALKILNLRTLPKLKRFCGGPNLQFQFPSLEHVTVGECPNMKLFCKGGLSTPKLSEVCVPKLNEAREVIEKRVWESDLNSTVRHLYREKMSLENNEIESESE